MFIRIIRTSEESLLCRKYDFFLPENNRKPAEKKTILKDKELHEKRTMQCEYCQCFTFELKMQ